MAGWSLYSMTLLLRSLVQLHGLLHLFGQIGKLRTQIVVGELLRIWKSDICFSKAICWFSSKFLSHDR